MRPHTSPEKQTPGVVVTECTSTASNPCCQGPRLCRWSNPWYQLTGDRLIDYFHILSQCLRFCKVFLNFGGTGKHLAIHVLTCVWHESLGAKPFNSIDFKQSIQYKAHHIRHFSSALTHPCNSPGNKVTAAANTGQRVSSDALKACEGSTFAERVVFLYLLRMGQFVALLEFRNVWFPLPHRIPSDMGLSENEIFPKTIGYSTPGPVRWGSRFIRVASFSSFTLPDLNWKLQI